MFAPKLVLYVLTIIDGWQRSSSILGRERIRLKSKFSELLKLVHSLTGSGSDKIIALSGAVLQKPTMVPKHPPRHSSR
jgi:hypothetical protein